MVNALSHERVIQALRSAITNELKGEMNNLKTLLEKKDQDIESLKTRVGELEYQHNELQQYSRRNSIRVSGLVETPNEDPAELSIDLFNNRMKLAIKPDDDDDNFIVIAIYMYITRHTCNGMRFAPELLHSMPTIQYFHTYNTSLKRRS